MTNSSNACATIHTDEIKANTPGGQEPGKTNTSLLLDQDGKFVEFGSKARDAYYEYDDKGGMLFETFKMRLGDKHSVAEPLAYALNGKSQPLLKVIVHSLKYVQEQAMEDINRSQDKALGAHEIKWVITGQFLVSLSPPISPVAPSVLSCCEVEGDLNFTHSLLVLCACAVLPTVPAIWRGVAKVRLSVCVKMLTIEGTALAADGRHISLNQFLFVLRNSSSCSSHTSYSFWSDLPEYSW